MLQHWEDRNPDAHRAIEAYCLRRRQGMAEPVTLTDTLTGIGGGLLTVAYIGFSLFCLVR